MTAIIAYYEKNTQRAIICCDNIAKAESRYDINDKCFCLFNRFYIAVWGPHLLVDAVHITKDYEQYDNILKPQKIEDLLSILNCLYQTRVTLYKKNTKEEYQDPEKLQEAIIYDSHVHQMFLVSFGTPFNPDNQLSYPTKQLLPDGIHRFAFFSHFRMSDIRIEKFLSNPKLISSEQFVELDKLVDLSPRFNFGHRQKVGPIGSFFERDQGKIKFESAFTMYKDICEQLEAD